MKNPDSSSRAARVNLRSITRLVVGAALLGYEGLAARLDRWEAELDQHGAADETAKADAVTQRPSAAALLPEGKPSPVEPARAARSAVDKPESAPKETGDPLLYMAVGIAFGLQEGVERGLNLTYRATRTAWNLMNAIAGPIYQSQTFTPVRDNLDKLAERGQEEVDHWIETGRQEESHSRELAKKTISGQVDEAIQYLTANEEVQELIQSQSVGLVGEIVEETRERAISADNFIEAIVRSMFRLSPRVEIAEPPAEIRTRATPYRQIRGRIIRK